MAQHARSLAVGGQCAEAIPEFDRAIQMNPGQAELVRDRGDCYGRLGRRDEALRDLGAYLAALPGAVDAAAVRQRMAQIQAGPTAPPPAGAAPPPAGWSGAPVPAPGAPPGAVVVPPPGPPPPASDMIVVGEPTRQGETQQRGPDGARFRGEVQLEGGFFDLTGTPLGSLGASGQLGAQFDDLTGLYIVGGFVDHLGSSGDFDFVLGAVIDFTFLSDYLTVGAGPELAYGNTGANGSNSGGLGAQYGGRVHLAWNAYVVRGKNGSRRRGLTVGLDTHIDIAPGATQPFGIDTTSTKVLVSPSLSVGYIAF